MSEEWKRRQILVLGGGCSEISRGIPEADHVLAFCQASFRMTLSRVGFLTLAPDNFGTVDVFIPSGYQPLETKFTLLWHLNKVTSKGMKGTTKRVKIWVYLFID